MPLTRYDGTVLDNVPRPVPGALIYVLNQPTSSLVVPYAPLATIYSDNGGLSPITQPVVADGNGNYFFYANAGLYTVVITGSTLAAPIILPDQNLLVAAGGGVLIKTNGTTNSTQSLLNVQQGANITVAEVAGTVTITGSAAAITLKVNGSNASSQVTQNLVQGTGITVTDGGSGNITIAATAALALKVNGTPNGSQSILNLKQGTHTTVVDDGVGGITIDSAYPIFQSNATPLTSSATVNFQNGSGIVISNPSAGNVQFALASTPPMSSIAITLTSVQLLALKTTPVQILPAQGANTLIRVDSVDFEYVPNSIVYATVSTADLAVYTDTTKASKYIGDSTGLIDQSAKTFEEVSATTNKFFTTDAHSDNQPLMIANVGAANYTAGNGTLVVNVIYYIVSVV